MSIMIIKINLWAEEILITEVVQEVDQEEDLVVVEAEAEDDHNSNKVLLQKLNHLQHFLMLVDNK